MKIRTGFVSNSSSSSFVLRGIKVTKDELINRLKISQEEINECQDRSGIRNYDVFELIEFKLKPKSRYGQIQKMRAEAQGIILEEDYNYELDVHTTGNYFGNQDYENLIIGKFTGGFEDGEVTEIGCDEFDDKEILEKLEKLGFSGPLKTFVQMVSNDNY